MRGTRGVVTVALAGLLLLSGPAAAIASATGRVADTAGLFSIAHQTRGLPIAGLNALITTAASPTACSDKRYNLMGPRWHSTLRWRFKAANVPAGLATTATLTALQRGFANIVNARNDCGRPDRVSATVSYLGTTTATIGVTKAGRCGAADGRNVVGFGALPDGVLGVTCIRSAGRRIVEIDIRYDKNTAWTLSLRNCSNRIMLEAVATHEAGHAFGMSHVSESRHGRLTMSTYIDGPCQNGESTLGLGDMKGLEALY